MNGVSLTPGQAVPLQAFANLAVSEARLAWRSPRGLAFGVGLPIAMLVLFGELPHFQQHPASLGGRSRFDAEVPVLATFVIAALALLVLAGRSPATGSGASCGACPRPRCGRRGCSPPSWS